MKKLNITTIATLTLVTAVFFAGGCSSMPKKLSLPSWGATASPKEITAAWDTVLRTENEKVYRGFAARVVFYGNDYKKAVKVRGNFEVYVFDEEATGEAATTPVKIVRYHADDLKSMQSESKMFGTSYTIWVPWDELTPESEGRKLSLLVNFRCEDGTVVSSQLAKISMPASPEKMAEQAKVEYSDAEMENRLRQTALLTQKAEAHKANPDLLETEWKATVAEHVITRENRPQAMVTVTIDKPGFSRDGLPNSITPERSFASASDEQKYQAQTMVADARQWQLNQRHSNQTPDQPQNRQPLQNATLAVGSASSYNMPINQAQFQASVSPEWNGMQSSLHPAAFQPNVSQTVPNQSAMNQPGLSPVDDHALWQEFVAWRQQQAPQQQFQQQQTAQPFLSQAPFGNFAGVSTGTTLR